jgi:hypothetical protein
MPSQQESSRETGRSRLSVSAPRSVATILWAILFLRHRSSFAGIFQARPEEDKNNWRLASSMEK